MRKYVINESYFQIIDAEEKAYWLGFLAADGSLMKTKETAPAGVAIELQERDRKHLEKLREALGSTHPIKRTYHKKFKKHQLRLRFCSKKLGESLLQLGLTYRKSYNLQYPNIDTKFDRAFILGFFDGDGSIWKNKKTGKIRLTFTGGSKFILKAISGKIQKNCKVNRAKLHRVGKQSKTFRILYGGPLQLERIRRWFYSANVPALKRKLYI